MPISIGEQQTTTSLAQLKKLYGFLRSINLSTNITKTVTPKKYSGNPAINVINHKEGCKIFVICTLILSTAL